MKYLCMMHFFLGLQLWKFLDEIFLNQGKCAVEILKRFGMLDCKEMKTMMVTNLEILSDESSERVDVTLYRHIIDSQVYLKNTRSDIGFVVNTLSQYMVETRHVHLVVVRHVMRYLKGTVDYGLICK